MMPFRFLYRALKSVPILNRLKLFTTPHEPHPKTTLQSLPNELLLEIFSFLEPKPYIISHGVCQTWRELLPLTYMDPTCRRLLDVYHRVLETPDFEKTLEWTNQNLQPFDREEYIRCLLEQYPVIPEEFRMWILEWPARLVIQCIWPGLTFTCCLMTMPITRTSGVNWIAYRSHYPLLLALVYRYNPPPKTFVPGLFIWRDANLATWLVFAQDDPDLFGRVFITNDLFHSFGAIPYYPSHPLASDNDHTDDDSSTDSESGISEGELYLKTFDDWIIYLHQQWSYTVWELEHPTAMRHFPSDPSITYPVNSIYNGGGDGILPAPAWASKQRTIQRATWADFILEPVSAG